MCQQIVSERNSHRSSRFVINSLDGLGGSFRIASCKPLMSEGRRSIMAKECQPRMKTAEGLCLCGPRCRRKGLGRETVVGMHATGQRERAEGRLGSEGRSGIGDARQDTAAHERQRTRIERARRAGHGAEGARACRFAAPSRFARHAERQRAVRRWPCDGAGEPVRRRRACTQPIFAAAFNVSTNGASRRSPRRAFSSCYAPDRSSRRCAARARVACDAASQGDARNAVCRRFVARRAVQGKARNGSEFCLFHDPRVTPQQRLASRRRAAAAIAVRQAPPGYPRNLRSTKALSVLLDRCTRDSPRHRRPEAGKPCVRCCAKRMARARTAASRARR